MIVLDASAVLSLLLEAGEVRALTARVEAAGEAAAPELVDVEVAHALRRLTLAGEIRASRAGEAIADLLALPLVRLAHAFLIPRAWQLRNALTVYDAVYVALAEALDAPLLTRDARLARSHGHRARIELV